MSDPQGNTAPEPGATQEGAGQAPAAPAKPAATGKAKGDKPKAAPAAAAKADKPATPPPVTKPVAKATHVFTEPVEHDGVRYEAGTDVPACVTAAQREELGRYKAVKVKD